MNTYFEMTFEYAKLLSQPDFVFCHNTLCIIYFYHYYLLLTVIINL